MKAFMKAEEAKLKKGKKGKKGKKKKAAPAPTPVAAAATGKDPLKKTAS